MKRTELKKISGKKVEMVITFALLIMFLNSSLFAQNLKRLEQKSFDAKQGQKLTVESSVADVNISTWDKNEFYVEVLSNKDLNGKIEFSFEKTSNGIRAIAEKQGNWHNSTIGYNLNVKMVIRIPSQFDVDIKTSGGDVSIKNLEGYKTIRTSGGDIVLNNSEGEVKANTSGGDIKADINDSKINLETSGGDIDLNYSGKNKGIYLHSSGGDIKAYIPSSLKADVELSTSGGDIETRVHATNVSRKSSHRFIGELNGGGERLVVSASGGDITLKER